jgi:hypothetical protein
LTNKGIEGKARVTVRFLKYKINEYETLKREINTLQQKVDSQVESDELVSAIDAGGDERQ